MGNDMKKKILFIFLMTVVFICSFSISSYESKQVNIANNEITIREDSKLKNYAVFTNSNTLNINQNNRDDLVIVFAAMRPFDVLINGKTVYSYKSNDSYRRLHIISVPRGESAIILNANNQQYSVKAYLTNYSRAVVMSNRALAVNCISIGLNVMILFVSLTLYQNKKSEKYLLLLSAASLFTLMASFLTSSLPLALKETQYVSIQLVVNISMKLICTLVVAFLLLNMREKRNREITLLIGVIDLILMVCTFGLDIEKVEILANLILIIFSMWILLKQKVSFWIISLGVTITLTFSFAEYTSLVNKGILTNTELLIYLYTPQIGWTLYGIVTTGIVGTRFSLKFKEVDILNEKLEETNKNLDAKVEERTKQLQIQQEQKSNMMINIFHDLKSPLFGAIGCTEMIQVDDKENLELISILRERLEFVSNLIEQLFTMAKLENHRVIFHDVKTNMKDYLSQIIEAFEIECRNKKVKVSINFQSDIYCDIDQFQFKQAIQNILQNALKYSPNQSIIEIKLESISGKVYISVRDYGPGIKNDDLPHIFERYYQGQYNSSSKSAGLGLSIAKQIVQEEHGEIYAESYDDGSKFTILLKSS